MRRDTATSTGQFQKSANSPEEYDTSRFLGRWRREFA